jgi:nucleoside-diphosphate-sugar epimerase
MTKGRVLITGASGFVGRALVPALVAAGYAVRAAVRSHASFDGPVEIVAYGDLAKPVEWKPLLDTVDIVIHLAGLAHATRTLSDDHYDRVNRVATADLARAAAVAGVGRFIFISSIRAQTGPVAATTLTELDLPQPIDAYGRSKLAAEACVRDAGIDYTIFRPVLIYGPELKGNLATLRKVAALPVPLPFGSFRNRRSLLSIDALIRAIELAMGAPSTINETYVVADRVPIALRDIIAAFRAGRGRRSGLFPIPISLMRVALRIAGGPDLWERVGGELVVDPSKLIAAGWCPVDETRAALQQIVT